MTTEISKDLSSLTTIDKIYLDKIFDKVIWCISDDVQECQKVDDNKLSIDFGFGTINILITENEIKYNFIPSEELNKQVIASVIEEQNLLQSNIEKSLINKISNLYKDMF